MTTPKTTAKTAKTPKVQGRYVFPDPPEDPEDKMTSFDHLNATGNTRYLRVHLGNPETTLVKGERYMALQPTQSMAGVRYPDLLVAFGVDPAAYKASNAYVISEQRKPPDFVLEIASRSTGRIDVTEKRRDYADLAIPEYWRFDETGAFHGARLAGDRLVGGRWVEGRLVGGRWVEGRLVGGEYVAIEIAELPDGGLQGYSAALDLHLRWEGGELVFYDPKTGRRIVTLEDERARADVAETERDVEREARFAAEARAAAERAMAEEERAMAEEERAHAGDERARADSAEASVAAERARADSAEARIREVEEQMRRQNP